jgi:hypothetical protein
MVFAEIIPNKLYQSRYPSSDDIQDIQTKYKINVIVDLAGFSWSYKNYVLPNTEILLFPIFDYSVPSRKPFKKFIKQVIDLYNQEDKVILVHCQGGRGRSTIATACLYGVIFNKNGYESIAHIGKCTHMNVPENREQEYFIHRFIRKYSCIEDDE